MGSSPRHLGSAMNVEICDHPIFVLGAPRSGTSMLQWALRQHPDLWGGQESDYLIPLVQSLREAHEFGSQRDDLHWLSGQGVDFDELCRSVGVGINALYMSRSGGRRWVEQTPQYTLHLDDMVRLFPGAQFLCLVRDGRDVVHSLRHFVHPETHERACELWRSFNLAALEFARSAHGDRLLLVPYRAVVEETEDALRKVYDFVGEPFEPKSVDFVRKEGRINSSFRDDDTASRDPGWSTWTAEERRTFDDLAGHVLIELGFEPDRAWLDAPPPGPRISD